MNYYSRQIAFCQVIMGIIRSPQHFYPSCLLYKYARIISLKNFKNYFSKYVNLTTNLGKVVMRRVLVLIRASRFARRDKHTFSMKQINWRNQKRWRAVAVPLSRSHSAIRYSPNPYLCLPYQILFLFFLEYNVFAYVSIYSSMGFVLVLIQVLLS